MTIENNFNNNQIYAGFWVRAAAAIMDGLITAPFIIAIFAIIGFDLAQINTIGQIIGVEEIVKTPQQKAADFIYWVIAISYSVYFVSSKNQATPGKRIMNIYIASEDGKKLSSTQALGRYLASILSGLLLGAGFLMVAFTQEKTALHDLICKTRVFYGRK